MEMTNDHQAMPQNATQSSSGKSEGNEHEPPMSSFLQAAKWSLAARHLPVVVAGCSSDTVAASNRELKRCLSRVLDHGLSRVMLGLDRSLPALRALLVLATWASALTSPLESPEASKDAELESEVPRVYDGELLLCTAVHLASQMHLEIDVETAFASADNKLKEVSPGISQRTLDRARVVSQRKGAI
jgi:hypothetical protein